MRVQFVSTVAIITPNPEKSRELLVDALGLPLAGDTYAHSEDIEGVKHLGVWPLADAAQACFGADAWPPDRPVPQMSIEFDVENPDAVEAAAHELEDRGYQLVHGARGAVGADGGAAPVDRGRDHRDLIRALDALTRNESIELRGQLGKPGSGDHARLACGGSSPQECCALSLLFLCGSASYPTPRRRARMHTKGLAANRACQDAWKSCAAGLTGLDPFGARSCSVVLRSPGSWPSRRVARRAQRLD